MKNIYLYILLIIGLSCNKDDPSINVSDFLYSFSNISYEKELIASQTYTTSFSIEGYSDKREYTLMFDAYNGDPTVIFKGENIIENTDIKINSANLLFEISQKNLEGQLNIVWYIKDDLDQVQEITTKQVVTLGEFNIELVEKNGELFEGTLRYIVYNITNEIEGIQDIVVSMDLLNNDGEQKCFADLLWNDKNVSSESSYTQKEFVLKEGLNTLYFKTNKTGLHQYWMRFTNIADGQYIEKSTLTQIVDREFDFSATVDKNIIILGESVNIKLKLKQLTQGDIMTFKANIFFNGFGNSIIRNGITYQGNIYIDIKDGDIFTFTPNLAITRKINFIIDASNNMTYDILTEDIEVKTDILELNSSTNLTLEYEYESRYDNSKATHYGTFANTKLVVSDKNDENAELIVKYNFSQSNGGIPVKSRLTNNNNVLLDPDTWYNQTEFESAKLNYIRGDNMNEYEYVQIEYYIRYKKDENIEYTETEVNISNEGIFVFTDTKPVLSNTKLENDNDIYIFKRGRYITDINFFDYDYTDYQISFPAVDGYSYYDNIDNENDLHLNGDNTIIPNNTWFDLSNNSIDSYFQTDKFGNTIFQFKLKNKKTGYITIYKLNSFYAKITKKPTISNFSIDTNLLYKEDKATIRFTTSGITYKEAISSLYYIRLIENNSNLKYEKGYRITSTNPHIIGSEDIEITIENIYTGSQMSIQENIKIGIYDKADNLLINFSDLLPSSILSLKDYNINAKSVVYGTTTVEKIFTDNETIGYVNIGEFVNINIPIENIPVGIDDATQYRIINKEGIELYDSTGTQLINENVWTNIYNNEITAKIKGLSDGYAELRIQLKDRYGRETNNIDIIKGNTSMYNNPLHIVGWDFSIGDYIHTGQGYFEVNNSTFEDIILTLKHKQNYGFDRIGKNNQADNLTYHRNYKVKVESISGSVNFKGVLKDGNIDNKGVWKNLYEDDYIGETIIKKLRLYLNPYSSGRLKFRITVTNGVITKSRDYDFGVSN